MAPDIQKLGKAVMIGGTDPQLTHWALRGSFPVGSNKWWRLLAG
jgi:G:T/U-mismatch repair DNA glycosylase